MNPERLKLLHIADFNYWEINLHEDQAYLGRSVIWSRRDGDIDFLDMNDYERDEFFDIGKILRESLRKSFRPDRMNYASFAKTTNHLHVHVIPRYKHPREFCGVKFIDRNYRKNYAPYQPFIPNDEVLIEIRDTIKDNL
ncbi:hypothetical protein HYT56_02715 [Candidatus Woesearchaeota archaeon]|nr:hypothetical protein [Candidatus Woesearchaeota archaeon]